MTPSTQILELPGCGLTFRDTAGGEPAVVFLHGAGADGATFAAQAAEFERRGRHTIVVDLRGHGASRPSRLPLTADLFVDDIQALVAHLHLERPVLVGHSLGGNIAQELVRRAPERFSALAVLDATWSTGPLGPVSRWLLRLAAPALALIPARSLPRVMADASAVTPAARADAARAFGILTKPEFLDVWRATTQFVRPDPGYRTPIPLLLVRGAEDRTGNISTAMPRWAEAEGVVESVIPGAGHFVTLDAPEASSAVLTAFVDGLK